MLWSLTLALTRRYLRNRVAIFFTVIFPIIFLLIFGGIFGQSQGPSFRVGLINRSNTEFARAFAEGGKQQEVFKITDEASFDHAKVKLGRGEYEAILELPPEFGALDSTGRPSGSVIFYYDQGDDQLAQTFSGVMQGIIDSINQQFVRVAPPLRLEPKPIQTVNLSRFDYTFAGVVGFSIMGLGIFSMANGFTSDKKSGSLRRLRVAPIRAWHLIMATCFNRVLVGIISVIIMFIVAVVLLDFNMRGDYISFILFSMVGTICMFGFGMAIAGWAADDNQAAPISNLVSFPMMFLSGTFFPRYFMPDWLQNLSDYLPLTPIIDGLRLITTEGKTILELGPQFAVISGWVLVMYLLSFRIFRWE